MDTLFTNLGADYRYRSQWHGIAALYNSFLDYEEIIVFSGRTNNRAFFMLNFN